MFPAATPAFALDSKEVSEPFKASPVERTERICSLVGGPMLKSVFFQRTLISVDKWNWIQNIIILFWLDKVHQDCWLQRSPFPFPNCIQSEGGRAWQTLVLTVYFQTFFMFFFLQLQTFRNKGDHVVIDHSNSYEPTGVFRTLRSDAFTDCEPAN